MRSMQDTIAAIATPWGEGGIGVVRVSGSSACQIVKSIFQPVKPVDLETAPSHTCYFGTIKDVATGSPLTICGDDGRTERPIDQAVVTLFRAPHSYTGEDVVEISTHGSPLILNQTLRACIQQGARIAEPGEFTQRAFLSGKIDLTQAEAVADLIRARTDQAHSAALSQLEGHLAAKVRALRNSLLPLLAHVEVGLDHSDDNQPFLSRKELTEQTRAVQREIEALLQSARVGKILREGLRVALVGRPNVGKSSLLNALLKEDRAIVTPIPGTTRDTLEESVNWAGIPVVLTDTAGVREAAQDPVERLGMERTRKALSRADVVLGIFDTSEPLGEEDLLLIRECVSKPHLWVLNKADLPPRWDAARLGSLNGGGPAVLVSAKTGQGLELLVAAVKNLSLGAEAPVGDALWMINNRHQAALENARAALSQAAEAAQKDAFEECVALELHAALGALGEIIGETATDDLLAEIFSKFCIGK